MDVTDAELLVVVEVPKSKQVLCYAEGCGRAVFKRVHVIRESGQIHVYGQSCAHRLFGNSFKTSSSVLRGAGSVSLSERDVDLLLSNTKLLVLQLEEQLLERKTLAEKGSTPDFRAYSDTELKRHCLEVVRRQFREEKGLNPDLPGWAGWVKATANRLYQKIRDEN